MTRAFYGRVHGKTIEFDEELGEFDGQDVEVQVRVVPRSRPEPGEGLLRSEGALADDGEWDAIMAEIYQARKQERQPDVAERAWISPSTSGGTKTFLLDTDTCSAHLRRPVKLAHRFVKYTGQMAMAALTLAELYACAYRHSQANRSLGAIGDLLQEVQVIDFDSACARRFGHIRGTALQRGVSIPTSDLMIASAAIVHNLALVTHNPIDYQNIPGLRLDDWLKS